MARFDCLERPLSIFFCHYGRLVARQPHLFLIIPILLTGFLSLGFLHFNSVADAVFLFTPTNAVSKYERAVIHEKWPLFKDNFIPGRSVTQSRECQLIVRARHNGNILSQPYAAAVQRLNNYVVRRVLVDYVNKTGWTSGDKEPKMETWDYNKLCLRWRQNACTPNLHMNLVNSLHATAANITWPQHRFPFGPVYLASSMGGVKLRASDNTNSSFYVDSSRTWLFIYQLQFQDEQLSYISALWEKEYERLLRAYEDPYLEITVFHSQTLTEELKRNAETLVPKFVISFTVLITFAMLCAMSTVGYSLYIDWVMSKPVLAFLGVLNAGMGVVSAIGLLNFTGMMYNDIVNVMPFLVVAIGVDNMFLLLAAFKRTDRSLPVERRMGECLAEAAISITITALTDSLSFGVGTITTIPAVQIFCVYTCIAIVMTFLYQLTFFVAVMVYYARLEEQCRHSVFYTRTVAPVHAKSAGFVRRVFMLGSRPFAELGHDNQQQEESIMTTFFRDWYGPVLMQPLVKGLVLVWFAIYAAFAIFGCTQIREGLEPVNLLVSDSYAIPHYKWLETYYWKYGVEVQIIVNNAPNMTLATERVKLKNMVTAFASTRHTIGVKSVQWWLNELEHFVVYTDKWPLSALNNAFYTFTRDFMNRYDTWQNDIKWNDPVKQDYITAFRFVVGMRDFETTNDQRETTELLREVASRYPEYNVTTFMPLWLFTDQYSLILPNTVQNIGIALGCMVVIALLLIPQPVCAFWVAIAIASIDAGVVGYMTLWDVKLDAISMITIIMSIGFSVDFSAHITYGYVVSTERSPSDRVRVALAQLGWPILQGAFSTIIGVLALSDVDAYMIVTFFKTVFLVISIGAMHGLVFLPVLLSLFVGTACVGEGAQTQQVSVANPPVQGSPSKRKQLKQVTPASGRVMHVRQMKRQGAI